MKQQFQSHAAAVRRLSPAMLAAVTGMIVAAAARPGWSATVEEITVTTRRSEESVQEIPVAVTAFGTEFIQKQGITTTADVVKLVPGVQFDQSFSGADTRISVRGINSERGRASAAVLIDGIDVSGENITAGGGSSLLNTRLLDLERVEVIKGPQSALYGRNAFAGAINYITKQPSLDESEVSIYADLGGYKDRGDVRDLRARFSAPLIDGVLAGSLNVGVFEDTGAYVNNNPNAPAANVPLGGSESVGARGVLLWSPAETLAITGSLMVSSREAGQRAVAKVGPANTFYLNQTQLPAGTTPDFSFNGAMNYGQWIGTVDDRSVSPSDIALSLSQRTNAAFAGTDDDTVMGSVKVEWDVLGGTVKSVTSWLDNEASLQEDAEFQDGIGTPLELAFAGFPGVFVNFSLDNDYFDTTDTTQKNQELTYEADWEGGNVLLGASYYDEKAKNSDMSLGWYNDPNLAFVPGLCGSDPFQAACGYAASAAAGMPPKLTQRDTKSWSVFGLIGIDLTERLRLTAEARYIKDEITVTTNTAIDRVSQYILNVPIDLSNFGPPVPLPQSDTQKSDTINPRLALDFSLNDDILLYASAAKGTKPAGFGTSQFALPQAARIDQEKLYAYEVGTKTSWLDGRLLANAAVYFNQYEDRQVGVTVTDPNTFWPAAGIVNAAEAETKGFEVDVSWNPIDPLTLAVGYAYTNAEWKDFNFTDIRNAAAGSPVGPTAKDQAICGNVAGDCSGADVAGVPEDALTLIANWTAPLNDQFEWFANVIGTYQSERALYDRINTAYVDSYWNWDAQLGIQNDNWVVQVYANNFLDDKTPRWAQGYQDFRDGMYGGGFGGEPRDETVFAFLPPPRQVGLRVNYSF